METLRYHFRFRNGVEKGLKTIAILDLVFGLLTNILAIFAILMLMTHVTIMESDGPSTDTERLKVGSDVNNSETSAKPNASQIQVTSLSTSNVIYISVSLIICSLSNLGVEIWLCWILYGAAKHADVFALKKWWWLRLLLTVFEFSVALMRVFKVHRAVADWLVPTIFAYRICVLVIVRYLRQQLYV